MVRQTRIEYNGALYHITSRGNARQDIYLDDNDRLAFLETLRKTRNRYHCTIYAYCLMDNHYHLLVETPDANISQFMRQLNGVYTQTFNRTHDTVGHLFQGRFKSILVQKNLYLLELARYIVLNPVRAGMVKTAKDWHWSSYRATANLSAPTEWINSDWILAQFSKQPKMAIKKYQQFVTQGKNQPKPWEKLRNQVYLGSESFVERAKKKIPNNIDRRELSAEQSKPRMKAKSLHHYQQKSKSRNKAIQKAFASGGYSMKEIGDYFKVHYSTVSRVVNAQSKT